MAEISSKVDPLDDGGDEDREENEVETENEKAKSPYRVYFRRHLVLSAMALTAFSWYLEIARYNAVASSYARYHDTTNEINIPEDIGIDMLSVSNSVVLLFSYFFAAHAVDRYGLRFTIIGASFSTALSSWLWLASGDNLIFVILARTIAALFAPMAPASLLAISNRWYAENERAKATAIASLVSVLGSGLALVVSPMFKTQENELVDLELKSCNPSPELEALVFDAELENRTLECVEFARELAKEQFCCYLPVDIVSLNLFMAIVPTIVFIYAAIVVRDLPPTPPSAAAEKKEENVSLLQGLKWVFSNQRFAKLSASDFLVSGPPLVLFATISRIFPEQVADYSFYASAIGLFVAIPAAIMFGHYIDKTKRYYEFALLGYSIGTVAWVSGTVAFASGTLVGAWFFFGLIIIAVSAYVWWQVSVFECKLEYVFNLRHNVEGVIVGADRIAINLSSIVFVAAIPPERVNGALNTMWIGSVIMVIGLLPTIFIRDKYAYKRLAHELEQKELQETKI